MKAIYIAILFMALFVTVSASGTVGLTPWVYIGSSTTFMDGSYVDELETSSGEKVDSFRGTIVGFSVNKQWENNLIFGLTYRNVEKGFTNNYVNSSAYFEAVLSLGYAINIPLSEDEDFSLLPYIGLGSSSPYNADYHNPRDYFHMTVGINLPTGVGWIMGIDYSIGLQDAIKDKDSKFNNLNFTLGHRF